MVLEAAQAVFFSFWRRETAKRCRKITGTEKEVKSIAYKALYRQWRPRDFEGLIGQDHVGVTLKNAITTGRISHAYLFTGPRGTGKTSTAKVLAKALNCESGPTPNPCNVCRSCELINEGTAMDVFEIDAASNRGIDEIRDLRENVKFSPAQSRFKVYIIDEVHMLTNEAFNALLKTLEEPPVHVVFVLATTEPHKIPATILSRCQRYDFRRVSMQALSEHLTRVSAESGITATAEALRLIALQADGGVRDAISILDQCSVLAEDGVTESSVRELLGLVGQEAVYGLFAAIAEKDTAVGLELIEQQMLRGRDARQLLLELASYCRSLMLFRAAPNLDSPALAAFNRKQLEGDSSRIDHNNLVKLVELFYQAANDARWSVDPRITAEMAVLSACLHKSEPESRQPEPPKRAEPTPRSTKTIPVAPFQSIVSTAKPEAAELDPGKLESLMEELLKRVEQAGKRSVKAQLADARLVSCSDNLAILRFKRETIRERVAQDEIRKWLETLLGQVLSRTVSIRCELELKTTPEKNEASVPKNLASNQEYPETVLKIHQLFGGRITKLKEE